MSNNIKWYFFDFKLIECQEAFTDCQLSALCIASINAQHCVNLYVSFQHLEILAIQMRLYSVSIFFLSYTATLFIYNDGFLVSQLAVTLLYSLKTLSFMNDIAEIQQHIFLSNHQLLEKLPASLIQLLLLQHVKSFMLKSVPPILMAHMFSAQMSCKSSDLSPTLSTMATQSEV